MIILNWSDNVDTWSYVHWIGSAYLTATIGPVWTIVFAVLWECADLVWSIIGPPIEPYRLKDAHLVKWTGVSVWIDRILDRRGASYGDLIMCAMGILTYYAQMLFWPLGVLSAVVVFALVEKSRE